MFSSCCNWLFWKVLESLKTIFRWTAITRTFVVNTISISTKRTLYIHELKSWKIPGKPKPASHFTFSSRALKYLANHNMSFLAKYSQARKFQNLQYMVPVKKRFGISQVNSISQAQVDKCEGFCYITRIVFVVGPKQYLTDYSNHSSVGKSRDGPKQALYTL